MRIEQPNHLALAVELTLAAIFIAFFPAGLSPTSARCVPESLPKPYLGTHAHSTRAIIGAAVDEEKSQ
jgi:hypothetical protein